MSTERTFGSKLLNSETLLTAISSFRDYEANIPDLEPANLERHITAIKPANSEIAICKQNYSLSVDIRQGLFITNPKSIQKLLSPINATVKAIYGRNAKQSTDVAAIISKIRGDNNKIKKNPDDQSVSQSHRSFGSKIQYFGDTISNLKNFGSRYDPSNQDITVESLNHLHSQATDSNQAVANDYAIFKQKNAIRIEKYAELSALCQRIKDSIKSQYGNSSSQYLLIKGLKI